ncbi:zinc finger protein 483-like [Episyrphus balteatus]|uniref:zinc finger protein 483-like n=1 Tax=Episyrphus balteatus TaxID=286459 RepID=UPI00248556E0|nr:zinc finger protein 483-like [Episyrphus balteatus]
MESEKSEINWQLICRICLQSSNSDMKYIFDASTTAGEVDVASKIIKCGGVPVEMLDGMPDRICNQCLLDLNIAFTFQNTCQESYYHMLKFIKTREQEHQKNVKIEESEEPEAEFIKVETIYNDEVTFSPEAIDESETLDDSCTLEDTVQCEDVEQLPDETVKDPIKTESSPANSKKIKKPRKRSKKEKTNEPRGRKPNPINKFICHICGNIYSVQSRLSQHIKRHTEQKEHECEICGKKFAAAAQIPRHMNTHTGNRPYKCKFCPSSFGDSSTRNKHQRIHTNERPFKCTECGKAFAYTNVLKVHMSIHTGDRPYSCSVCDKRFSQRHHQQSHERTHMNFNGRNAKID